MRRRNESTERITQQERKLLAEWRAGQSTDDTAIVGGGEGIEVTAPMTASVWKIQVTEGDAVKEGQVLAILEAMKMEIRESRHDCADDSYSRRRQHGGEICRTSRSQAWNTAGSRTGSHVLEINASRLITWTYFGNLLQSHSSSPTRHLRAGSPT